jgi:hypothetical protein
MQAVISSGICTGHFYSNVFCLMCVLPWNGFHVHMVGDSLAEPACMGLMLVRAHDFMLLSVTLILLLDHRGCMLCIADESVA